MRLRMARRVIVTQRKDKWMEDAYFDLFTANDLKT